VRVLESAASIAMVRDEPKHSRARSSNSSNGGEGSSSYCCLSLAGSGAMLNVNAAAFTVPLLWKMSACTAVGGRGGETHE
jgi:hypothetical protein